MEVCVVGGGASGTLVAAGLLRHMATGRVTVVERSGRLGRGVAYGTTDPAHLLNVPSGRMSAFPDQPGHFSRWLGDGSDTQDFVPRVTYGRYLEDVVAEAASRSRAELRLVAATATGLTADGVVTTHGGVPADAVVLALGNLPPVIADAFASIPVIRDPWTPVALDGVLAEHDVLVLGTGLTMVDVALALDARGHRGRVLARSRRGLSPLAHAAADPVSTHPGRPLRDVSRAARAAGGDWRGVIDGLRSQTPRLWQTLSWEERALFFRRLSAFWDVHRHRVPPAAFSRFDALRSAGRLDLGKGRALRAGLRGGRLEVEFMHETVLVDAVINCTGPQSNYRDARIPLLEDAVALGLACYDPLGLGLMVDDLGRTEPRGRLFALGPLCRGCRLETTAVPEIREQADAIARFLSSPLPR